MAVPSDADSTPSPADVDAIATRRFSTSFRGWDPDEVRAHLVGVAEIVRSLQRRQADLERLLAEAEAAARRADLTRLDADEVARILGEETARVLRTARESADEIAAKAQAQAELLAGQAADDAAGRRAEAEARAEQILGEAREQADATRAAGEAHLADLRAAADAEVAEERRRMEEEIAAERQDARDEVATMLATAENHAISTRGDAEEDAQRVRSEADAYAAEQRVALDAELADRRAASDAELTELTTQANTRVAEAELMRDRVLADLARRRRAARQHLEQLQAGRDRLLAAYEVIRVTSDQATDELSTVLTDAKRAADDAARRIGSEELPTPEEMLAELDLARLADLPIISGSSDAAIGSNESDTEGEPSPDEAGPSTSEATEATTTDLDEAAASTEESGVSGAEAGGPSSVGEEASAGADSATVETSQGAVKRANQRHQGRRARHRHDPLGGESLPEVPMTPVDASAEFESVRIVTVVPDDEAATAVQETHKKRRASPAVAADLEPSPVEPALVPSDREDVVSDIFARLRAAQEPDDPAGETVTAEPPVEPARSQGASSGSDISDKFDDETATAPAGTAAAAGSMATDRSTDPDSATEPASSSKSDRSTPSPMPETPGAATPDSLDDERLAFVFERRDAAVDEVARRLAKHLKRRLSDQQSDLLDRLRRNQGAVDVDAILGAPGEFAADWDAAIRDDLTGVAAAGVTLAGDLRTDAIEHAVADVAGPAAELVDMIASPLRARLARALGEGSDESAEGGDDQDLADRIRACYREWRGARMTASVADACGEAFGLGVRAGAGGDVGFRWYCGPVEGPCSDCFDNQLAGVVPAQDAFPTGQVVAPAHPGCRCLVLPEVG